MIAFSCPKCGKSFRVADEHAGRSAHCKACGTNLTIPSPQMPAIPAKVPMRMRRLRSDAESMLEMFKGSPIISVEAVSGDPAEVYHINYNINGLERGPDGQPQPRGQHQVEIQLTSDYPRLAPKCKMLTPIFHPNIEPAAICVGDHWTAGERLGDLVVRIGEMIAYQQYNIRSPLDGE